jgi:predicted phage-related endonuclease
MPHYWMQVQWELGVTGCERGSLACLFRGFEFESFPIERDDRMIKKMFEAAEKFWEYNVIHGIPPEPINAADAKILYPEHTDGKIYDADYELYEKALQLTSVKERLKELQATEKDLSDELKTAVKDSEEARYNGLKLFTFKAQSTTTLDAKLMKELEPDIYERYKKTSEYRVLRLSPLKEYLNA